ncbi:MAG: alpha/beta hydrolase, partial [Flavobacterium sp.]
MKKIGIILFLIAFSISVKAQETKYQTKTNIHYYSEAVNKSDDYIKERCILDIYYPENSKDFPTVVWFHGGGLTQGEKEIP